MKMIAGLTHLPGPPYSSGSSAVHSDDSVLGEPAPVADALEPEEDQEEAELSAQDREWQQFIAENRKVIEICFQTEM